MDEISKRKKRAIILGVAFQITLLVFVLSCLGVLVANAIVGAQTRGTLIDCVEPEGKCFEEGQDRTAGAVQQLIEANQLDEAATRRIVIIAVTCQQLPGVNTIEEVQQCVDQQLALDKEKEE